MSFGWLESAASALVILVLLLGRWIGKRIPHGEARFDSETGKLVSCAMCGRPLNVERDVLSTDCGGECWGCVGQAELDGELDQKVRAEIARGLRNSEGYPTDGYY